jgi:outer membrane receptor protein involved in Fe transport
MVDRRGRQERDAVRNCVTASVISPPSAYDPDVAAFEIRKQNVLYTEVDNGVSVLRTVGPVRSRGVEVGVSGSLTNRINLITSYGYTNAVIAEDPNYAGNVPMNVPRYNCSLQVAYDFSEVWGDNKLKISAGLNGQDKALGSGSNLDHGVSSRADRTLFSACLLTNASTRIRTPFG